MFPDRNKIDKTKVLIGRETEVSLKTIRRKGLCVAIYRETNRLSSSDVCRTPLITISLLF